MIVDYNQDHFAYFSIKPMLWVFIRIACRGDSNESNRKAMNRNWSNQKENPALKTKSGNK